MTISRFWASSALWPGRGLRPPTYLCHHRTNFGHIISPRLVGANRDCTIGSFAQLFLVNIITSVQSTSPRLKSCQLVDKAPAIMDPGALVVLGCSGTFDLMICMRFCNQHQWVVVAAPMYGSVKMRYVCPTEICQISVVMQSSSDNHDILCSWWRILPYGSFFNQKQLLSGYLCCKGWKIEMIGTACCLFACGLGHPKVHCQFLLCVRIVLEIRHPLSQRSCRSCLRRRFLLRSFLLRSTGAGSCMMLMRLAKEVCRLTIEISCRKSWL